MKKWKYGNEEMEVWKWAALLSHRIPSSCPHPSFSLAPSLSTFLPPLRLLPPSHANVQRQALAAEHERNLPGLIFASKEEFFIKMEDLCSLGSSSIIKAVRNLLMLAPTDSRKMQAMEVFSPQAGGGALQAVLEQLFSTSGNTVFPRIEAGASISKVIFFRPGFYRRPGF